MPGPQLGSGRTYEAPPIEIQQKDPILYDYLFLLHARLFGINTTDGGDLDDFNMNASGIGLHSSATHNPLRQGSAVANDSQETTDTVLSVTSPNGTDLATTQTLANELKEDLNAFFTEYNLTLDIVSNLIAKINELLASLRTGKIIGT